MYDYGFRIYDPRIAKFLSVDPLSKSYPWYTPYQFAGNKPIWAVDLDGLEEVVYQYIFDAQTQQATLMNVIDYREVKKWTRHRGTVHSDIVDRRTGQPFTEKDAGKVQYECYSPYGPRIDLRRNEKGNYVEGKNELMSTGGGNWFSSTYIGPNNPEKDGSADYRREPLNIMDAGALQHDKDYDAVPAAGPSDAIFNKNTLQADIDLVQRANGVIEMFNNKEIDPYTGAAVSKHTYNAATKVKAAFSAIALDKSMPNGGLITSTDLKKRENVKQELTKVKR